MLKLEDIHWSDASTLAWLAYVARRLEPARLLILATMRPADPAGLKAGLDRVVDELGLHGQCHEVVLSPLSLSAIERYLEERLAKVPATHRPARSPGSFSPAPAVTRSSSPASSTSSYSPGRRRTLPKQ